MKKLSLFFAFFALGCFLLSSCSQDENILSESEAIRDYQTDAQILSKFVDVNKSVGEYFINENKKMENPV